MKRTRLFDGKLRLIDEQLYTIVEASRIVARHLTFSLSLSLAHSFTLSFSLSHFFPCSRSRNGEAAWLQINLSLYKYVQCNVRDRRASLLCIYIYIYICIFDEYETKSWSLAREEFWGEGRGGRGNPHVNHAPLSLNMTHALPSLFHIPPPENSNSRRRFFR